MVHCAAVGFWLISAGVSRLDTKMSVMRNGKRGDISHHMSSLLLLQTIMINPMTSNEWHALIV